MSTSGKLATATIGNAPSVVTITGITKGELAESVGDLNATDSDSAPYSDTDAGIMSLGGTLEMHFRPDGMQTPVLRAGSILTNLRVYPHGLANEPYLFPLAICLTGTNTFEVEGQVNYRINFKNKGPYSIPNEA